jgi:hypothetical protein
MGRGGKQGDLRFREGRRQHEGYILQRGIRDRVTVWQYVYLEDPEVTYILVNVPR